MSDHKPRGWRLLFSARCEHASLIASEEWDGPVERDRLLAARVHCLCCGPCQQEARAMRWLRRLLRQTPAEVRAREAAAPALLTPEAAERLKEALRDAVEGNASSENF